MRQRLPEEFAAYRRSLAESGSAAVPPVEPSHQPPLAEQQNHDVQPSAADEQATSADADTTVASSSVEPSQASAIVEGASENLELDNSDDEAAETDSYETQSMSDDLITQADNLLASSSASANDVNHAISLLSHAATLGSSHAHIELGKAYLYGDLASRNLTTAFHHFQLAADSGKQHGPALPRLFLLVAPRPPIRQRLSHGTGRTIRLLCGCGRPYWARR